MNKDIDQIKEELAQVAAQFGINSALIPAFARAVVDRLSVLHGARRLYVPAKGKKDRDSEVLAMFNGVNHADVCEKFGISKSTLYRIIRS